MKRIATKIKTTLAGVVFLFGALAGTAAARPSYVHTGDFNGTVWSKPVYNQNYNGRYINNNSRYYQNQNRRFYNNRSNRVHYNNRYNNNRVYRNQGVYLPSNGYYNYPTNGYYNNGYYNNGYFNNQGPGIQLGPLRIGF